MEREQQGCDGSRNDDFRASSNTADLPIIQKKTHSVLNSTFQVLLPKHGALLMSDADFQVFVQTTIEAARNSDPESLEHDVGAERTTAVKRKSVTELANPRVLAAPFSEKSLFVQGLEKHAAHHRPAHVLFADNKALTANLDVTNASSKNPIVDVFYGLNEGTFGQYHRYLLEESWDEDALLTLKVIFNARSIHLGKGDRIAAYKALGWLYEAHPLTLLANLPWLVRPVIAKKGPKPDEKKSAVDDNDDDEDFEMIDATEAEPVNAHDVRYGVSHGYWKDLLNLVVFAALDQLSLAGNIASILNVPTPTNFARGGRARKHNWYRGNTNYDNLRQHQRVQDKLNDDPCYRALHMTVARLFARQLKEDKDLLNSSKESDRHKLSLAAKWAPSHSEFHDKHTFILSSIAEILFPDYRKAGLNPSDRELHLRFIREECRFHYLAPLRKALKVVERDVVAGTFEKIKYDHVPSLAMDRYTALFMKKDYDRFKDYIADVTKGGAKISGATLLPSTLIAKAAKIGMTPAVSSSDKSSRAVRAAAETMIDRDVVDGQWNTLVKRVRDAGVLESSLAICDVSGSMSRPLRKDGSCPMDSAIGLSLIIAEITAAPFGGGFISFHETPTYLSIGGSSDNRSLVDKVRYIKGTPSGYTTDFVAIFENIILPMAVANKIKPEDMVKQIFVFSDMQFDQAQDGMDRWTTSYDRIKTKYESMGYDMPRMIFWNLGATSVNKPITMDDVDTALVSGYSQGMLRAFLETGTFGDEEEIVEDEDEATVEVKVAKKKIDPLTVVKKAVSHKAYSMLKVVD